MFIVPTLENFQSRNFPYVTTLLITVNCLIYFFFQYCYDPDLFKDPYVIQTYGFISASPTLLTSFTSMFLHGDVWHLVGNMVCLFLVGVVLESAMGSTIFLIAYLAAGIAEPWMTLPFMHDDRPSVGASGAISGIMGTYSVVMGMTRIPVFYSFGFYFGNGRLPALILIFFWIIAELFYFFLAEASSTTNYLAHIAGFIFGGIVGLIFKRLRRNVGDELFINSEEVKDDKAAIVLAEGLKCLRELRMDEARRYVSKALGYNPNNTKILIHLFNIDKQQPESDLFQKTAVKLLAVLADTSGCNEQLLLVFRDYCTLKHPANIPPNLIARLTIRFAAKGVTKDALLLLTTLMHQYPGHEQIPDCLLMCGRACLKASLQQKGQKCFLILSQQFPGSVAAQTARLVLDSSHKQ